MLTKKLSDKEFRSLLCNLFIFNDLIGEGKIMDYRSDIEECMTRVKEDKEVNLWIMDVNRYSSKKRKEGWVSLGVQQVSSALGAVSESMFGSDTLDINSRFSLQNILRSVYNEREKTLVLEILLESTFIWEEEVLPEIKDHIPIRSMDDAKKQLEIYRAFVNKLNLYEVTKRLYQRYGDNENISEWTRFHVRVVNEEYAALLKKVKMILSNKLDDVQLPTMLLELQRQVEDMERVTKKLGGGRIKR